MIDPILVEVSRNPLVESVHRGAACVVASDGRVIGAWGDIDRPIFPRSAIKFIQALPLVESGAADAFAISEQELALACASHSGEERHVAIVRNWLARIELSENDLVCGPHPPSALGTAEALFRSGVVLTRAHNNCSGKHAGFLTLALHLRVPIQGYARPDHPVQAQIRSVLSELSEVESDRFSVGNDGCGAANFGLPLQALARAFAKLTDPRGLPLPRQNAVERIAAAIRQNPFLVAGTDRHCTRLLEAVKGGTLVKIGAEGVYVAMLPAQRLGIAVKIADGATRAAEVAISALLHRFGVLADRSFLVRPITNTREEIVGHIRPAAGWP